MNDPDGIDADGCVEMLRLPNGHMLHSPTLDVLPGAVIVTNREGRITGWNKAAETLYGFQAEEVLHQYLTLLCREAYSGSLVQEMIERVKEQGCCEVECTAQRRSGEKLWVHLTLALLRAPDGADAGMIVGSIDITERKRSEQELRESEERYQLAAEAVDAFLYEVDLRTDQVFRSKGLLAVLGFSPSEVPDRSEWWQSRIHPDDLPNVLKQTQAALTSGDSFDIEYQMLHRRGDYIHLWDRGRIVRDEQGRAIRTVGYAVNITDRRKAEEALKESEERHRLLSELTLDYTYTCRADADGTFWMDSVTPGFTRVTGYTLEEAVARGGWVSFIHPDDLHGVLERSSNLLAGTRDVAELRIITKSGQTRWIRYSAQPIWDEARGRIVRLLGAVQDITERKDAEAQFHEYALRLRALSRRLLQVQEQERRHLARELHDEVAQTLTALMFTLDVNPHRHDPGLRATLEKAQAMVKELTTWVRDLSLRLRPTMLDDLGLLPALVWLFQRYTAQTQVQVDFQHRGLGRRFRPEVETAAYRIVQEALTNVARHAGASEAAVRVWLDQEMLCLQIEDRGAGFDTAAAGGAGPTGGLSGMQERANLLGGWLTIESVPGAGTFLAAELPVGDEEEKSRDDLDAPIGR